MDKVFLIIMMLVAVLATDSDYSVIDTVGVYGTKRRSSKEDKNVIQ